MPPRRLLLAPVVALVAFALWLLLRGETTPAPHRQTPAPPPTATLPAESTGDAAPNVSTAEREPAPAAPPPVEAAPAKTQPPLSGTVQEHEGSRIPGILIELLNADGNTLAATTSGADGKFAFDCVVPAAVAIASRPAPDGLPRMRHGMPGKNRRGEQQSTVHLLRPPSGTVTGIVVDDHGNPVAGAKVTTDRPYQPINGYPWHVLEGERPAPSLGVATDADGRFGLPWCKVGMHLLRAEHDAGSGSVKVDANATGVVIRLGTHLGGAVTISGQVIDGITGAPIAGAEVRMQRVNTVPGRSSTSTAATVRTDTQGRYEVPGLDIGHYRIVRVHRGYTGKSTSADYEAGHHVVDLVMLPTRKVPVRVVLPDGQPIAGAPVQARDADGAIIQVPDDDYFPRDSVKTDAAGRVSLRALPAAQLTLLVVCGDFIPAGRAEIDLRYGAPDEVVVELPSTVMSFARQHFFELMDADGKPAEIEGTVVASSFDGDQLLSRVEGRWRDGAFYLGNHQRHHSRTPVMAVGAIAGACRVEIAAPGYQLVTLTLEPDAKSPTTVTLRR